MPLPINRLTKNLQVFKIENIYPESEVLPFNETWQKIISKRLDCENCIKRCEKSEVSHQFFLNLEMIGYFKLVDKYSYTQGEIEHFIVLLGSAWSECQSFLTEETSDIKKGLCEEVLIAVEVLNFIRFFLSIMVIDIFRK